MSFDEISRWYNEQFGNSSYQYLPVIPNPDTNTCPDNPNPKPSIITEISYYDRLSERVLHKMGMENPEQETVKQLGKAIEESEREIKGEDNGLA